MLKNIIIIGFMLFAVFFGAGNLIFPAQLGFESGIYFKQAIVGFLLTGVGLTFIGMIAGAIAPNGLHGELSDKVHPLFSKAYMMIVFLAIGPLFCIPRTATVSYEMGIIPFVGFSTWYLLLFSIIFFACVFYISINPSKMVNQIGKYLTPALLITIILLFILSYINFNATPVTEVHLNLNKTPPFIIGFMQGYQTMDAMGTIAIAIIMINAIHACGIKKQSQLILFSTYAMGLAAFLIALVYIGIGWIGNHFPIDNNTLEHLNHNRQNIGAYILSQVALQNFGSLGPLVISLIVILACLTSAVGLVSAASQYFHSQFPKVKYVHFVAIFTFLSLIIANQGLEQLIHTAIPVLLVLYPLVFVIIALTLINSMVQLPKLTYQLSLATTLIISFLSLLNIRMIKQLPLSHYSLEWIIPTIIMMMISYILVKIISIKKQ